MAGMTMRMRMNVRTPVAQVAASCRSATVALPRIAGSKASTFLVGSSGSFATVSARSTGSSRCSRLVVKAAKKSVGDLGKPELEGKTVLVRFRALTQE